MYRVIPTVKTWFDMDEFYNHHMSNLLSPVARLLLAADGSMTQMLEALLLTKISMSIERQEVVSPEEGVLELAGFKKGGKALAREAWLTNCQSPLIYAHSLLFTPVTPDGEKYSLSSLQEVKKPLGRMVRDDRVKTFRHGCRMGLVKSRDISEHLALPPDTDFWGRYYRLTTDSNLTALIFELFSPGLLKQ